MKMDLQTSYVPFWNGISVSNSLILSNLGFFGFFISTVVKNVCAVFYGPDSINKKIRKIYKSIIKDFYESLPLRSRKTIKSKCFKK